MIWIILLVGVGLFAWFLIAPRRFQTLESTPAVVDEEFHAHHIIETEEDPREVSVLAYEANKKNSDKPVKGHGDSLTFDWPQDPEPHQNPQARGQGQRPDGPINPQ